MSKTLRKIGQNIDAKRKEKNLTIERLGELCEMGKQNMHPILRGKQNVTIETLSKIAKALEVDLKDLFTDVEVD